MYESIVGSKHFGTITLYDYVDKRIVIHSVFNVAFIPAPQ